MTNTPVRLEYEYPDNGRHVRILRGDAIIGWFHWREWPRQSGYQFCPSNDVRKRSRVLRPDLFTALTKAARISAPEARAAIATATGGGHDSCGISSTTSTT